MQLSFVFFSALVAAGALADSVTITATADAHIIEVSPDNNTGGEDVLTSGTNLSGKRARGLVKFNLSQVPANASVKSAAVTLVCIQVPGTPADSVFDFHRLLADWGEGTGAAATGDRGRLAVTGEATWNARFYPSTLWSAAGAAAPTDFSATLSASKLVQSVQGTAYTFGSTPEMVADVQQWLTNPSTNFGWIVVSESEATAGTHRGFGSSEDPTVANRPVLTVQYVIPVTPTIKSIQKVGSAIQFVFGALAGQPYTAEYRDSLTSGNWITLTSISPQPSNTDITVTDPTPPATQRFYRVSTTF